MANLAFLYPDYCQPTVSYTATIAALTSYPWDTSYPLSNLFGSKLAKSARSISSPTLSDSSFDIDFKTARTISMFAIGKHNMTSACTLTITLSNNSDMSSPTYTSSAMPMALAGQAEALEGYNPNFYFMLPAGKSGRYLRCAIAVSGVSYAEISRVMVGGIFQPAVNTAFGATSMAWETNTQVMTSLSGVDWHIRKAPRRVINFGLSRLTDAEAFDTVFQMQKTMGIDKQSFVALEPPDAGTECSTLRQAQQSYICTLKELSPIEYPYNNNNSTALSAREVL